MHLVLAQALPQHWVSELMNMGYISYFPILIITWLYFYYTDRHMAEFYFLSAAFDVRLPADSLLETEFELSNTQQISVPGFGLLDKNADGTAETLPAPINPRVNLNNQPWSLPFESRSRVISLGCFRTDCK